MTQISTVLCGVQKAAGLETALAAVSCSRVELAATAYDVLRLLNSGVGFDGYIISFWFPDLAGLSVCREIRKVDPHAPICFYAAPHVGNHGAQHAKALRAGANTYIVADETGSRRLSQEFPVLLGVADSNNSRARRAAEAAVWLELDRWATSARGTIDDFRRTAKPIAKDTFFARRGTLAAFERWWAETFLRIYAAHPISRER